MADGGGGGPELGQIVKEWDRGSRVHRQRMLEKLIEAGVTANPTAAGPLRSLSGSVSNAATSSSVTGAGAAGSPWQPERMGDTCALLFFLRIVTAMKIAYVVGGSQSITPHLQAIATFLNSPIGARFPTHFVQAGGLRTVLHIISKAPAGGAGGGGGAAAEREVALALRLLLLVAKFGRTAKESICEHNGISCLVERLTLSSASSSSASSVASATAKPASSSALLELGRDLLIEFGSSNPRFAASVRNGLLCLISSSDESSQRLAAQVTPPP